MFVCLLSVLLKLDLVQPISDMQCIWEPQGFWIEKLSENGAISMSACWSCEAWGFLSFLPHRIYNLPQGSVVPPFPPRESVPVDWPSKHLLSRRGQTDDILFISSTFHCFVSPRAPPLFSPNRTKKISKKMRGKKVLISFFNRILKVTGNCPTSTQAPFYHVSKWVRPKNITTEVSN